MTSPHHLRTMRPNKRANCLGAAKVSALAVQGDKKSVGSVPGPRSLHGGTKHLPLEYESCLPSGRSINLQGALFIASTKQVPRASCTASGMSRSCVIELHWMGGRIHFCHSHSKQGQAAYLSTRVLGSGLTPAFPAADWECHLSPV